MIHWAHADVPWQFCVISGRSVKLWWQGSVCSHQMYPWFLIWQSTVRASSIVSPLVLCSVHLSLSSFPPSLSSSSSLSPSLCLFSFLVCFFVLLFFLTHSFFISPSVSFCPRSLAVLPLYLSPCFSFLSYFFCYFSSFLISASLVSSYIFCCLFCSCVFDLIFSVALFHLVLFCHLFPSYLRHEVFIFKLPRTPNARSSNIFLGQSNRENLKPLIFFNQGRLSQLVGASSDSGFTSDPQVSGLLGNINDGARLMCSLKCSM